MSMLRQIFAGESTINFRPKWRKTLAVSGALLLVSAILLLTRGLNLSIDFEGGGVWEVPVGPEVSVADGRNAVSFLDDARIQLIGSSGQRRNAAGPIRHRLGRPKFRRHRSPCRVGWRQPAMT